jgi:hypothetical protein
MSAAPGFADRNVESGDYPFVVPEEETPLGRMRLRLYAGGAK